jgi:hypothetical protein
MSVQSGLSVLTIVLTLPFQLCSTLRRLCSLVYKRVSDDVSSFLVLAGGLSKFRTSRCFDIGSERSTCRRSARALRRHNRSSSSRRGRKQQKKKRTAGRASGGHGSGGSSVSSPTTSSGALSAREPPREELCGGQGHLPSSSASARAARWHRSDGEPNDPIMRAVHRSRWPACAPAWRRSGETPRGK